MKQLFEGIKYIEEHLFEKIDLNTISKAAGYSEFHFSRMFRAIVGESVMSYVRKRRLSLAVDKIARKDVKLIDLAIESQFESQESFSRAFKKMFSLPPGEYRKLTNPVRLKYREKFTKDTLKHLSEGITMEPRIVTKESFKCIGIEKDFTQDSVQEIGELWNKLATLANSIPNQLGCNSFGICEKNINRDESDFTYTAALQVSKFEKLSKEFVQKTIPSQQYAVFTHKLLSTNISKEIKKTLNYIWGTWIPKSKYECAETPDFEFYDERFNPQTMQGEFDIYIPIKEK